MLKDKKKSNIAPQQTKSYAKYSGMAFQMGIIILLGTLLGQWLDTKLQTAPYLTILLALFSIFAALYIALKDFLTPPANPDEESNQP